MKGKLYKMTGLMLLMALAAWICAGCGGEYIGMSGNGAVSGGGVSGQAVSGGAVKPAGRDRSKKYTYCNEHNLYYIGDDFKAVERDRETGVERKLREKIENICYVDEDWLYYLTYIGDEADNQEQIWRVPVRKEQQWKVDESAEEMILEKDLGGAGQYIDYWCNGSYIVFLEDAGENSTLRMYNIQKKQYDPAEDIAAWNILALVEDRVIFNGEKGLGEKKFGAEPVNWFHEMEKEFYLDVYTLDTEKDEFFWEECKPGQELPALWRYRLKDGEKKKIADADQIRQFLEKKGLLEDCEVAASHDISIWGCFVQENTLYVQIRILGGLDEPYCDNVVMISKDLSGPGEWRWEKEINEYLHNPESEQKFFRKIGIQGIEHDHFYRSRGCVVAMAEGICLMYLEHTGTKKNQYASYDLHTGKFEWLTEKDEEWYLQYYDRYNTLDNGMGHYGNYIMYSLPNNYGYYG